MNPDKSSWRNIIPQQLSGPAITDTAQKRRHGLRLKQVLTILAILLIIGGGLWFAYYIQTHGKTLAPYAQNQGKTKIVFFSDGQLNAQWFDDQFGNVKQKDLLSIDIAGVQSALLKNPQVLEAQVERHFPNTLKVALKERLPLGRIKLKMDGKVQVYYVARDGELFTATTYKPAANLPFISGADIHVSNGLISPLGGMATLADLLDGLKKDFAEQYVQVTQIDLAGWTFPVTAQTSVCLQLRGNSKLRFGPEKIDVQLARLQETLELMKAEKQTPVGKLIDLTYPDRVAIVGGNDKGGKKHD